MQNSFTNKAGYLIIVFITIMLLPVTTFSATQQANNWLDEPVTIHFQNEPLGKVLEKVSKQTGIAILYDQELANDKVSGNYKDVKASDAINRLFSEKNKSIQVSKDKKVIVVKTFGAKDFIWAGAVKGVQGKVGKGSLPITLAELDKLHELQYNEYKDSIANENEVVVGSMTHVELQAMHKQQYEEYQAYLSNDNEKLDGGMTRSENRAMHKQQYEEYQARLSNDNEKLDGGMTRGEVKAMQEKQYNEYQERIANDGEVLGKNGMTRGELRKMHEKQYKEFQQEVGEAARAVK